MIMPVYSPFFLRLELLLVLHTFLQKKLCFLVYIYFLYIFISVRRRGEKYITVSQKGKGIIGNIWEHRCINEGISFNLVPFCSNSFCRSRCSPQKSCVQNKLFTCFTLSNGIMEKSREQRYFGKKCWSFCTKRQKMCWTRGVIIYFELVCVCFYT